MTDLGGINQQERLLTLNIHNEPGIAFDELGIKIWPLFIDVENSVWVMYASYRPGITLPRHFHTGAVHFFTTKGAWNYLEHPEDVQTAGSYLYEPAGTMHTFSSRADGDENVEGFMVINGANVNFDADGNFINIDAAGSLEEMIAMAAEAQGIKLPRYIRPTGKLGVNR